MKTVLLSLLLVILATPMVARWHMLGMPGESFEGPLPALSREGERLAEDLRRDVEHLAGAIGERHVVLHDNLERAADWIERELRAGGYEPRRQTFPVDGKPCHNIEVEIEGKSRPDETVLLGAHYDTVLGSPGANDNGSGVASLLALARRLQGRRFDRTLRMVWFTNEEAPHYHSDAMGSLRYARRSKERREKIVGMLSLETMGYFTDAAKSQEYPPPLDAFYPDRGNFIAFVSNLGSRKLLRRAVGTFRAHAHVPSEGGALPASLPGVGWSDHWSFWQQGYDAIMVTDTAPFRYPHYHTPRDTPDEIDYGRLARVTLGLENVARALVGGA